MSSHYRVSRVLPSPLPHSAEDILSSPAKSLPGLALRELGACTPEPMDRTACPARDECRCTGLDRMDIDPPSGQAHFPPSGYGHHCRQEEQPERSHQPCLTQRFRSQADRWRPSLQHRCSKRTVHSSAKRRCQETLPSSGTSCTHPYRGLQGADTHPNTNRSDESAYLP